MNSKDLGQVEHIFFQFCIQLNNAGKVLWPEQRKLLAEKIIQWISANWLGE